MRAHGHGTTCATYICVPSDASASSGPRTMSAHSLFYTAALHAFRSRSSPLNTCRAQPCMSPHAVSARAESRYLGHSVMRTRCTLTSTLTTGRHYAILRTCAPAWTCACSYASTKLHAPLATGHHCAAFNHCFITICSIGQSFGLRSSALMLEGRSAISSSIKKLRLEGKVRVARYLCARF